MLSGDGSRKTAQGEKKRHELRFHSGLQGRISVDDLPLLGNGNS